MAIQSFVHDSLTTASTEETITQDFITVLKPNTSDLLEDSDLPLYLQAYWIYMHSDLCSMYHFSTILY